MDHSPEGLSKLGLKIQERIPVNTIVIHPTTYALAVSAGCVSLAEGPFTPKPRITTGAGDHFNSGFCLGKLLGFDDSLCLLTGVATSGYYVRTANSPTLADLVQLLKSWPGANS
jgi:sugar/nucleoside kinase (ribokinase family)